MRYGISAASDMRFAGEPFCKNPLSGERPLFSGTSFMLVGIPMTEAGGRSPCRIVPRSFNYWHLGAKMFLTTL